MKGVVKRRWNNERVGRGFKKTSTHSIRFPFSKRYIVGGLKLFYIRIAFDPKGLDLSMCKMVC